jgi:hypothetical protein
MKKHLLSVAILLIVAILSLAITSSTYAQSEPVGERIFVYDGSIDFPAGIPFNIWHGWVQTSDDEAIGIFDFELEIDGVLRSEDFKMFTADSGDPDILWRRWVFNFPDGMTGTHTFTGHWYAPCRFAVDELGFPGPCATPNEKVENKSKMLIVTFIPSP